MTSAGKKIFVVDDEPTVIEYLRALLTAWGFSFAWCEDGGSAPALIEAELPDLVLLDVMLPDVDGVTVCRRLRSNPKTARIPVIMLTSLGDSGTVYESLLQGAEGFVTKPVDVELLKGKIEKVLKNSARP